MKKVVVNKPYEVVIAEEERPVRKEGEALLKMVYGGICGTDLNIYRGTFAYVTYPRIPCHELCAQIVEIGENDRGLAPGMMVTVNPYFNCGVCYSCQRGLVNCCMQNETMGAQRDGAFKEYFTMPIERVIDGKGLPEKTIALIEPFGISYHGSKRANIKPGEKVLVVGAGTIGILAAISAKLQGAVVYACDTAPKKLEYAKAMGVDGTILNDGADSFLRQVEEITGGNGFDVAIEAVGLPETFQNCIDAAAFGGRVVLIGVGKRNLDFNFTIIQKKELNVFGSRNCTMAELCELVDLVKKGGPNLEGMITGVYDFEDAPAAYRQFDEHAGETLKIMLKF